MLGWTISGVKLSEKRKEKSSRPTKVASKPLL